MSENVQNINVSELHDKNSAESREAAEKKLKRKNTVRAYYIKNQDRIREKARQNYWKKIQEEEKSKERIREEIRKNAQKLIAEHEKSQKSEITGEKGDISLFLILFGFAGVLLIFWILTEVKPPAPRQTANPSSPPPPSKITRDFDIGDGRIIKIPINWTD